VLPRGLLASLLIVLCPGAAAQSAFQWNGFALLRAGNEQEERPLQSEAVEAQVQVGLEWWASPKFGAHLHLLGRTDDREAIRGHVGIPEAYVEANFRPNEDRLRLRAGAFFLPTSRENVDSLWESPYAITSSALNSWMGEEFRPVGVDATWVRGRVSAGATVFRGNDTFGALPVDRNWSFSDHWTLLGEWFPVSSEDAEESYYTSVSAETDGRLGWSARTSWNGQRFFVQATHIDNRSDGLEYGALENWGTRFDILAFEYATDVWTVAAESGWGPTFIVVDGQRFVTDIDASYLLVSRQWDRTRATVRLDTYKALERDYAVTVAAFFNVRSEVRLGAEMVTTDGEQRGLLEVRYRF
jgi:hypothetical protein